MKAPIPDKKKITLFCEGADDKFSLFVHFAELLMDVFTSGIYSLHKLMFPLEEVGGWELVWNHVFQ